MRKFFEGGARVLAGGLLLLLPVLPVLPAQAAVLEQIAEVAVPDANQGVGVDRDHFYAVNNRVIGKYDKRTSRSDA